MRFVVDQIKDGHPVADGRQQTCAIVGVDEIAFSVDSAQQV